MLQEVIGVSVYKRSRGPLGLPAVIQERDAKPERKKKSHDPCPGEPGDGSSGGTVNPADVGRQGGRKAVNAVGRRTYTNYIVVQHCLHTYEVQLQYHAKGV